jgi:hypothetical protein
MKTKPNTIQSTPLVFALMALLVSLNAASGDDARLAAFYAALTNVFVVNTGATEVADLVAMVDQHKIDSANGNQATQPYKRFRVPVYPVRQEDPEEAEASAFRLRPDEAVVYVGPTPPQCTYFSFCPFLFVRHTNHLAPKGDWLVASLRDPLNNLLIKTEGNTNAFASNTLIIFTPDARTCQAITNCAQQAGYPESMINLCPLPADLLYLGVEPNDQHDTMVVFIRTAYPASDADWTNYINNDYYATVYRLTPRIQGPSQPYTSLAWRNRDWTNEIYLVPGLSNAVERLEAAIIAATPHVQVRSFGSTRWWFDSRDVLQDDPKSPAYRQFVAGESSDTPYLRTAENGVATNFTLGTDDLLVVYGVNHQQSGLATYSNFALYGDWKWSTNCDLSAEPSYVIGCSNYVWNGVAGLGSHEFGGSAAQYLPSDPVASNYLYAVKVVRGTIAAQRTETNLVLGWSYGSLQLADDPGGPWVTLTNATPPTFTLSPTAKQAFYRIRLPDFCLILPEPTPLPGSNPPVSADGIGLNSPILVGYRAYLNTSTKSGPSYDDIIPDRALLFKLH